MPHLLIRICYACSTFWINFCVLRRRVVWNTGRFCVSFGCFPSCGKRPKSYFFSINFVDCRKSCEGAVIAKIRPTRPIQYPRDSSNSSSDWNCSRLGLVASNSFLFINTSESRRLWRIFGICTTCRFIKFSVSPQAVQSSTIFPLCPDAMVSKPSRYSDTGNRWVMIARMSSPLCSMLDILYQVSNISRP